MLKRYSLSLRQLILIAVAVGIATPAILVLMFSDTIVRRSVEPILDGQRRAVLNLGVISLIDPLWVLDPQATERALDQLLSDESVCAVTMLEDRPGAKPVRRADKSTECDDGKHMRQMSVPIKREGVALGTLTVDFDDGETDRLLRERQQQIAFIVGLQVVLGGAVILLVLYWRLVRPIEALKRHASAIASREPHLVVDWHRGDELGELGEHLNHAGQQIDGLLADMEAKNTQLRQMAMYDHLTQLPNRTLFREVFTHEAAFARRNQQRLALLFVDLDRFKNINDTLGHAAGDRLLLAVSERLRAAVRGSDLVCRISGDEFLLLLREASSVESVQLVAQRLLASLSEGQEVAEGQLAAVSASVGIALFPEDGENFDELVRHADMAMYRAKQTGRASYSFYQADMDVELAARLEMERELVEAIRSGQLVLHYQPIVDGRTGAVASVESLVRWQHPQRGLQYPGSFIPVAEDSGLIREIGLWTLEAACQQLARWKTLGRHPGSIAVNLSAINFKDSALIDQLTELIQAYGVGKGELTIELTESTVMTDTEASLKTIQALRGLGVSLAVDDFGTGYSSLAYLKVLRPRRLKIDRSFVRDLPDDPDDCVLVKAVLGLAEALDIDVVAEGVETEAQRDFLLQAKCVQQQGYLHAKPMPPEQIGGLLRTWP
ncbi:putative bifunctional diguanylate cyclase/phosphodiesterase [Inhella gelatinilytica]|uniref:EAL domain-containing protein n=1 Tax=Inhella gelatinilytica TaxID=2795030 RepID=A0A931ND05_9BURK|nr:EAL domain-containing protein [Inhella gelatinilytica]MBH9551750.1 EAL domain-containing protein [Inhella gelatinilytica]